jgi:hypothetical protein
VFQTVLLPAVVAVVAAVAGVGRADRISRLSAAAVVESGSLLSRKGFRSAGAAVRVRCRTKNLFALAGKSWYQRVHRPLGPGSVWFHCAKQVSSMATINVLVGGAKLTRDWPSLC